MRLLYVLFLITSFPTYSREFKQEFQTDQCTFWLDSFFESDWSHCCEIHDFHYWIGGSNDQRKDVDYNLYKCVQKESNSLNSLLMFIGVKIGKKLPFKIKTKEWGNAWSSNPYQVLESNEQELLIKSIQMNNNLSRKKQIQYIQIIQSQFY